MPELLSPGVYIQEVPARLKAIEGVSTSTAGFVGRCRMGPIAGTAGLLPTLVTSFGEFTRIFGAPTAAPETDGYLPHAVRAFFDNGGKRAYISRVTLPNPARAATTLARGVVLYPARFVASNATEIPLSSLAGITAGAQLELYIKDPASPDAPATPSAPPLTRNVTAFDASAGVVTLAASFGVDLDPRTASFRLQGVSGVGVAAGGPRITARTMGAWGNSVRVRTALVTSPPAVVQDALTPTTLRLASIAGFYAGAIVIVDALDGGVRKRTQNVIAAVAPLARTITLTTPPAAPIAAVTSSVQIVEFDVTIGDPSTGRAESFTRLSWNVDAGPAKYYVDVLQRSAIVEAAAPAGAVLPTLEHAPSTGDGYAVPLGATTSGSDGVGSANADTYIGMDAGPGTRTALQALIDIDGIRIIACPDAAVLDPTNRRRVHDAMVGQCERVRYRFAVLDGPSTASSNGFVRDLQEQRNAIDSSFGALYAPWFETVVGDKNVPLPPSGHIVGVMARTDAERGVWKAPANEPVRSITGLVVNFTTGEQDILNPSHVNCVRSFEGRGTRVWGARTLSSDPEFRYVNVRRFMIFLEASIDRGTQWVVFEPNSPETWSRVVDSVAAFLDTQWRAGALLGRKPEDAFYVRCDESTMTADDIQNGRLICDIGVAIVRPAEFVVFRIEQITTFGQKN